MITHTQLKAALDEHLAKLVSIGDPDQLALHFQSQGMKAICASPHHCVLAQSFEAAVTTAFPDEEIEISVGVDIVVASPEHLRFGQGAPTTVHFPALLRGFIDRFDRGGYPELMVRP